MIRRRVRALQKKEAKQRRRRQDQLLLRASIERVIRAMGIHGYIETTRLDDRHLHLLTRPRPRVIPDPGQAHDPELARMALDLKKSLDRVGLEIGGEWITFNDYWTIGIPLIGELSSDRAEMAARKNSCLSSYVRRQVSEFQRQHQETMFRAYGGAIMDFLAGHSRFDTAIYTAKQGIEVEGQRPVFVISLRKQTPEVASVVEDGIKRRAYRCGAPADAVTGEVTWVTWDTGALGWGTDGLLPVYVQSHAIEQALRRLWLQEEDHVVHHLIWESLREPRLTPLANANFLADMTINGGKRVGYLVGRRLPDRVLIRTFLLLTMQGTPESQELYRHLRLRRPDIEYLGLDDVQTLATTDLLRDAEAVRIFEECGCRDLVRFVTEDYGGDIRVGHASRFKAFLGRTSHGRISPLMPTVNPRPGSPSTEIAPDTRTR